MNDVAALGEDANAFTKQKRDEAEDYPSRFQ